ncbi:MAG: hypothetical protein E5Y63_11845 [Mesorhizobium sp.]|uniref:hypothetical protein n=1 Tax=Mesorhizobium TaxID=68287 RepID=UPI0011FBD893|nr:MULTISPECIES: hypothetical protein [Mesorhizobium]MCF6115641.1 hypothetical protein [Mesorhizobium muleiense]TIM30380.1 MAG: hypothetical protein E5Y63_11845 [Mesorhizobium sp.]
MKQIDSARCLHPDGSFKNAYGFELFELGVADWSSLGALVLNCHAADFIRAAGHSFRPSVPTQNVVQFTVLPKRLQVVVFG